MSFQVTFNTVQLGIPPVILLSAGEDTFVACGAVVFLQGFVDIPENLPGHAIIWEQVAGVPVILSSTDTIATSYTFTERSDKIFRLWIDKGLPTAQWKEVSIFHTPTSRVSTNFNTGTYFRQIPDGDIVVCNTISSSLDASIPPTVIDQPDRSPCQPDGGPPSSGIDFGFTVFWTVPNAKSELIGLFVDSRLYYADTDTLVPNAIYTNPPGTLASHTFFPGGENERKRYYVVTTYKVAENYTTGTSCEVDYTTIPLPSLHVIDDVPVNCSLSNSITTIVKFGNIKENAVTDIPSLTLNTSTYTAERFIPTAADTVSSVISSLSLSNVRINIVRFDPGGIGT